MKTYKVIGMTCATCQNKIEKSVRAIEGVESCDVSLLTNFMTVKGKINDQNIVKAVRNAGYDIAMIDTEKITDEDLEDIETSKILHRFGYSLFFLLILVYFSMGINMFHFPLPVFLEHNYIALAIIQMLLAEIIMAINYVFYIRGFKFLFHFNPNMDSLVALGSFVSFAWSVVVLIQMTMGQLDVMMLYHKELYFESAAMIPTLITIGKVLESHSKGKTTNALKSLMQLAPKYAIVIKNKKEVTIAIEDVKVGDIFIVRPGESIAVDGIVIEGQSAVDEASLTGESIPIDKNINDKVFAATINCSGYLKCRATKVGNDTTLAQIIKMVSDASMTKAPIARKADRVSAVFVPIVIGISFLTLLGWLLAGKELYFALARSISVLVISCPCALGLATPVAIMVGNGVGAKNGILFKNATALEITGQTEVVVLDKTGTITEGNPVVTDVVSKNSQKELLQLALTLEKQSEHPLAKAIVKKAEAENLQAEEIDDFQNEVGYGISAKVHDILVHIGNERYICQFCTIEKNIQIQAMNLLSQGKTVMYLEKGGMLIGFIAVADVVKQDSKEAVTILKNMGIGVVMLTGDNEKTAKVIAKQVGVDRVFAHVLPAQKENIVKTIQKQTNVMMVGDGINDAPALTTAQIGVAIGAGTDVAIDAADIVLINSKLTDIVSAIRLSKYTVRNIQENLFGAFFYNVICIPLAIGLFSYKMNPMLGALAMSLSSFTVVSNALRINFVNLQQKKGIVSKKKIDLDMIFGQKKEEYELNINGMVCEHCEMTVIKALEQIDGIEVVDIEYKTGIVKIHTDKKISEDKIQSVVKNIGYEYVMLKEKEGDKKMKKTIKIEGMVCSHCASNVKKSLEALEAVQEAVVDQKNGIAEIFLSKDINEAEVKSVIEKQNYKFLGME